MNNKKIIAISKWQGDIDWEEVSKDNVFSAYSRLADGATPIDPKFKQNFIKSKSYINNVGAWQVFRVGTSTSEQQANSIITTLKEVNFEIIKDSFAFAVVKDKGVNENVSNEMMADNLYKLMSLVMDSGLLDTKNTYIKTNTSTWKDGISWVKYSEFFKKFNLWIDHWNADKPNDLEPWGPGNWKLWEYSKTGKINGIKTDVLLSTSNTK